MTTPATPARPDADGRRELGEEHLRAVRIGSGANCSSVGSVVDTLFATAAVGAAVFAGVLAALGREPVRGRRAVDDVGERKRDHERAAPEGEPAREDRASARPPPDPDEGAR